MDTLLVLWCSLAVAIAISNIFIDSNLLTKNLSASTPESKGSVLTANYSIVRVLTGGCLYVFDSVVLAILEIIIPIIALSRNIGIPVFAWISLAFCVLLTTHSIIEGIRLYNKRLQEIAAGMSFSTHKLSTFYKIVGLIPDAYVLYILLIGLNVIK
jgi:hypothetical protein